MSEGGVHSDGGVLVREGCEGKCVRIMGQRWSNVGDEEEIVHITRLPLSGHAL